MRLNIQMFHGPKLTEAFGGEQGLLEAGVVGVALADARVRDDRRDVRLPHVRSQCAFFNQH